ncbi:hypothetical protein RCC89_18865 [Cytophagaceae bacterium ABcell3]|nr:hypothetical protein RCC89_18865 [Cytophagaceae bacterium ABcell3]
MSKERGLEQYYSGDKVWDNWVQKAKEDYWKNTDYQKELLSLLDKSFDLAVVIYAKHGKGSICWLSKEVPALENLTPIECLKTKELMLRLRECLLRMP